jgi:hypothetical protein
MAASLGGGQYRHQDGHIVHTHGHVRHQWDKRCPPSFEGYNIRAAWRESERVFVPSLASGRAYCRYHHESGMVLKAVLGFVVTAVHIEQYGDRQQTAIRQAAGGSDD